MDIQHRYFVIEDDDAHIPLQDKNFPSTARLWSGPLRAFKIYCVFRFFETPSSLNYGYGDFTIIRRDPPMSFGGLCNIRAFSKPLPDLNINGATDKIVKLVGALIWLKW